MIQVAKFKRLHDINCSGDLASTVTHRQLQHSAVTVYIHQIENSIASCAVFSLFKDGCTVENLTFILATLILGIKAIYKYPIVLARGAGVGGLPTSGTKNAANVGVLIEYS